MGGHPRAVALEDAMKRDSETLRSAVHMLARHCKMARDAGEPIAVENALARAATDLTQSRILLAQEANEEGPAA